MSGCPVTKLAYYFGALAMLSLYVRAVSSSARIKRFGVAGRFSESVSANGMVYTSGQVGGGPTIQEATKAALSDLDTALALAGTDKRNVVSVTVYLKDIVRDYKGMNEVYDAWLVPGQPPCRATVQAQLADKEWLVEVSAVACSS